MGQKIVDYFDASQVGFSFLEGDGSVDGTYIIAKVRGPACFDGAASRNKRWYPEGHWPKQFEKSEVRHKLENRLMFGAWGHEHELTDEELAEGKHSHITTKLWMEGNVGMAEYLILNTPAGRILNTTLRAGSRLSVSTRGSGDYKGEHEGMPQVDSDSFTLDRIDFVVNPGFLQARPELVEAIREDLKSLGITITQNPKTDVKENIMPGELNETLVRENATLRSDLQKTQEHLDELKANNTVLAEQNAQFRQNEAELDRRLKEASDKLAAYEKNGADGNLKTKLDRLAQLEGFLSELVSTDLIDEGKVAGQAGRMSEAFAFLEGRHAELKRIEEEFGGYDKINEGVTYFENLVARLKGLGTLPEIEAMAAKFESLLNSTATTRTQRVSSALAKKYGVSESVIAPMVAKGVNESEIAKMVGSINRSKKGEPFRKNESARQENRSKNESATRRALHSSFGERLMATTAGMRVDG